MATITLNHAPKPLPLRWAEFALDLLAALPTAIAHAREAERLMGLSDDALARKGLAREDIVDHAFRA